MNIFRFLVLGLMILANQSLSAKTFIYCSEGSPSTFSPMLASDGTTFNASSSAVFNRLVEFKGGTTEIQPALAESWSTDKTGLIFTFKLRKGVKFQTTAYFTPTRELNADDVLFTFNRQRQKDHPYNKVSGGGYEYFEGMEMSKIIKDIKKVDDLTVQFELSQKEAPFLANLAMDFASIVSAEYADKMAAAKTMEKFDTLPVGTGPFVYESYQKDTTIKYNANPTYFRGKPAIDKLVFAITKDPSVRTQKLKAGECNLIAEPAPADIEQLKANKKITVSEKEGLNVGYLAFNTEKKPFDNLLVRQAIAHALNRGSYISSIYMNRAVVATNPIPPTIWSYNTKTVNEDYNIAKAKELLKKAGYPNGFETELWTLPVSRPYNPSGKKMGELMQGDLEKVGIKVKLVSFDWPTYLEKAKHGEHQMIQFGWTGDNGDPDNFFNVLLGCASVEAGSNYARWCNKSFNDLIQQAKQTNDVKKRTQLYMQAQEVFKKETPWATLAHAKVYRAMSKNVTGYQINPFGTENFEHVDIK